MVKNATDVLDWHERLSTAYLTIAEYLGRDNDLSASDRANMANTPQRAAKAFMEMTSTKTEIKALVGDIIQVAFPMEDENKEGLAGMITQGPIMLTSVCPHHWLAVTYEAYVSYIPKKGGGVLGLSKLTRLSEALAKRPVLQEQLAADIADVLHTSSRNAAGWPSIESEGSAVVLTGHHSCMSCRGVRSNALTTISELRGVYWTEATMEDKFYRSVEATRLAKLR